jgi:acetate kinase
MAWIGIEIDAAANARHAIRLERDGARVAVLALPTDEEAVILRAARAALAPPGAPPA